MDQEKYHRMRDCLEDLNGDAETEIFSCVEENFLKLRLWQIRRTGHPVSLPSGGLRRAAGGSREQSI